MVTADGPRNDEIAERRGTVRTIESRSRKRLFEDRLTRNLLPVSAGEEAITEAPGLAAGAAGAAGAADDGFIKTAVVP